MSENQITVQHYEDEIDLRELILTLWKQKYMIISFTLIAAILTGIVSMFVLPPVYGTMLNIVSSMPDKFPTKYGEYTLPITTNEQYIDLITSNNVILNTIKDMGYDAKEVTVEGLKKRISIGKPVVNANTGVVQNSFHITVSADNPQESLKLADTLFDNYIEFLDVMTKERAVAYFYNNLSANSKSLEVSLKSDKEILKKNEELLAQTPQTIDQKAAMQEIQGKEINSNDYIVFENIINENYTKIENDIIANKQAINDKENTIRINNELLEELDEEKKAITHYYETGKESKLESGIIGIVESSVYLPSPPVAPSQKTSPSTTRNVAIAGIIGIMLGVGVVYVKEYLLKWVQPHD